MASRAALALAVVAAAGCVGREPLGPGPGTGGGGLPAVQIAPADVRVLFVGNSLTYTNDLPGVVAALASEAGLSFAHGTVAQPGWSLEEHWHAGVGEVIREVAADVVVLQQGPSSLPESQAHLAHWTGRLAPVIREAGGEPALLMVWPDESRAAFFPDVRQSYAAAAEGVDGLFIPGGQTWVEAWARDGDLELWGPDRFHPAYAGTLAAAMAAYAVLLGADPTTIPDLPHDATDAETVALLREAVAAALQ